MPASNVQLALVCLVHRRSGQPDPLCPACRMQRQLTLPRTPRPRLRLVRPEDPQLRLFQPPDPQSPLLPVLPIDTPLGQLLCLCGHWCWIFTTPMSCPRCQRIYLQHTPTKETTHALTP